MAVKKSLFNILEEMNEKSQLKKFPPSEKYPVTLYLTPLVHKDKKVVFMYVSAKADFIQTKLIHARLIPSLIENGYEPILNEKIESVLNDKNFNRLTSKEWEEKGSW